ncbi:MAG TPA: TetR/AcrR family transcriptional regulator [Ktedonobacterales bacterium]|nr:TetR/AcrR family transcriptional regulator [Ktedonobacterales bacterium]
MTPPLKAERSEKTPHTAHGEAQRRALARAAYDLIAEKGFEGLRTRDVAERAGVNVATLHYYFKSKEDLIRGVVGLLREYLSAPLLQPGSRGPLEELCRELADVQRQAREIPEVFIVLLELHLRSLRDPIIKAILQEMDVGWREHITAYLTAGVQQGIFRADLDVPAAASLLMAYVKGAMMQLIYNPQAFPADRVSVEITRWAVTPARAETRRESHPQTPH